MDNKTITVTGGAGFIGGYLIKKISKNNTVKVIDKADRPSYLPDDITYYKKDLNEINEKPFGNSDLIIHLAGFTDVQESISSTKKSYNDNLMSTINILQNMNKNNINDIIFTSTSAVYGDKSSLPIHEDDNTEPESDYGSSKLAAENLIRTRSKIDEFNYYIFRLGNIVGYRGHGVIQDFIHKLMQYPDELKILGNGLQEKSYLYVENCISGILKAYTETTGGTYNIASNDTINVNQIADIVSESMSIDPEYTYTGGSKGWVGDIPKYKLSIDKIRKESNWEPNIDSYTSVKKTVDKILENN
jgi:UDP-glucose 4-epimerase